MTAEKQTRRQYTEDFKRDAMALVAEQGHKIAEAARSPCNGGDLIRRWKREFEAEASGDRLNSDEREELKRLRKENRMPRMEKEILKKPAWVQLVKVALSLRLSAGQQKSNVFPGRWSSRKEILFKSV